MSNDLKNIKPEFKEILQNKKIIAVNQDKLGIQGRRVFRVSNLHEVFMYSETITGQRNFVVHTTACKFKPNLGTNCQQVLTVLTN